MTANQRPARVPIGHTLLRAVVAVGALAAAVYVISRWLEPAPAAPGAPDANSSVRRLHAITAVLAISVMLVAAFLLGSYVMIRAGRAFRGASARPEKTAYADIWAQGRPTDEQIAEATREPDEPPARGPGDAPEGRQ